MTMKTRGLVACPECDALQRMLPLEPGRIAECRRCGAELYRAHRDSLDRTLALLLAAAIVFAFANATPVFELEAQGMRTSSTLMGAVRALAETGWPSVALLVFVTVILVPAMQLALALYLLVPIRLGRIPRGLRAAVRTLAAVWPWGMVEVFLLGALVSLVKLTDVARVHLGWGLYAVAAYILLVALAVSVFEPRVLWRRVEALRA